MDLGTPLTSVQQPFYNSCPRQMQIRANYPVVTIDEELIIMQGVLVEKWSNGKLYHGSELSHWLINQFITQGIG